MTKCKVEQFCVGPIGTNCYFLINTDTKETVVIDPGAQANYLAAQIKEQELNPVVILQTHGHFDHMDGTQELAQKFQIEVYIHEEEKSVLADPSMNVSKLFGTAKTYRADQFLKDGQVLHFAGFSIKVIHTPGHTPGGVCFYLEEQKVLFSGDTLFCESAGRTDFPGGSASALVRGIREKLMVLPDDVKVYPGHNQSTCIGYERMHNPFI